VHVPAKFVPHFKAGKELRSRVDRGGEEGPTADAAPAASG